MRTLTKLTLWAAILVLVSGCATHRPAVQVVEGLGFAQLWQAALEVRELRQAMTTRVRRFGRTVFQSGADRAQGTIRFTEGSALMFLLENTVQVKPLGSDRVEISVDSVNRTQFLPGTEPNPKHGRTLLQEIIQRAKAKD